MSNHLHNMYDAVARAPRQLKTRDRTDRVTLIQHLAVNTITPLTGNSVNFQDKIDIGLNEMTYTEMASEPGSAGTNTATLYSFVTGGKTQLKVVFQTGAAIEIAVEA